MDEKEALVMDSFLDQEVNVTGGKKGRRMFFTLLALILVLVIAAGGWIAVLLLVPSESETDLRVIIEKPDESVKTIAVEYGDKGFTLEQDAYGQWKVQGKEDIQLNQYRAIALRVKGEHLSASQLVNENADDKQLEEYGLLDSSRRITYTYKDGKQTVLYVGRLVPAKTGCYLRDRSNRRVYMMDDVTTELLSSELGYMRSIPSIEIDKTNIGLLMVKRQKLPTITLAAYSSQGMLVFALVEPASASTDAENVNRFIESVLAFAPHSFITDEAKDEKQYGFDDPYTVVDILDLNQQPQYRIVVGDRLPEDDTLRYCYVNGNPKVVYSVEESSLSYMQTTTYELTDKYINLIGITTIDGLDIITPEKTIKVDIQRTPVLDENNKPVYEGDKQKFNEYFYIDGKLQPELQFRSLYQSIIATLFKGELPVGAKTGKSVFKVVYHYLDKDNKDVSMSYEYFEYDFDHYAVKIDQKTAFYTEKAGVQLILAKLELFLQGKLQAED